MRKSLALGQSLAFTKHLRQILSFEQNEWENLIGSLSTQKNQKTPRIHEKITQTNAFSWQFLCLSPGTQSIYHLISQIFNVCHISHNKFVICANICFSNFVHVILTSSVFLFPSMNKENPYLLLHYHWEVV